MYTFRYGGKKGRKFSLAVRDDMVAVRTRSRGELVGKTPFRGAPVSEAAREILSKFEVSMQLPEAGVEVLRVREQRKTVALRDQARKVLKKDREIQFAGRVLCDSKSKSPVLYTENFFVKFDDEQSRNACRKVLKSYGLTIKRELEYSRNAYFVGAPEGTGVKIFKIAEDLHNNESVELCHPELIKRVRARQAFPQQWHLRKTTIDGQVVNAHANVEAAWAVAVGEGTIVAVIDNGIDIDHEEFRSSGKIVAPRDVTRRTNNTRPGPGHNHGTACAGVACAEHSVGAG